jgi:hypothetical protein
MPNIPDLAEKVKDAAHPPSTQAAKRRKRKSRPVVLPHYAMHLDAPTLSDVQQAALGAFARLMKAYALQQMREGKDGR